MKKLEACGTDDIDELVYLSEAMINVVCACKLRALRRGEVKGKDVVELQTSEREVAFGVRWDHVSGTIAHSEGLTD